MGNSTNQNAGRVSMRSRRNNKEEKLLKSQDVFAVNHKALWCARMSRCRKFFRNWKNYYYDKKEPQNEEKEDSNRKEIDERLGIDKLESDKKKEKSSPGKSVKFSDDLGESSKPKNSRKKLEETFVSKRPTTNSRTRKGSGGDKTEQKPEESASLAKDPGTKSSRKTKLGKNSPKKNVKFEFLSEAADPKTRSCRTKLEIEMREQLKKSLEELEKIDKEFEKEFQEEFEEDSEEDSVPSKTRSGRITRTSRQLMMARTADDSDKAEQEIELYNKKKVLEKLREGFAEKLEENSAPSKISSFEIEVNNKYSGKKYSERVREIMEKNKNID